MTLSTLLLAAVILPLTLVALVWLFAQALGWFAPRPRAYAILAFAIGVGNLAMPLLERREEGFALPVAIGMAWIAIGVVYLRRGWGDGGRTWSPD